MLMANVLFSMKLGGDDLRSTIAVDFQLFQKRKSPPHTHTHILLARNTVC